jgi:hypothetical protein
MKRAVPMVGVAAHIGQGVRRVVADAADRSRGGSRTWTQPCCHESWVGELRVDDRWRRGNLVSSPARAHRRRRSGVGVREDARRDGGHSSHGRAGPLAAASARRLAARTDIPVENGRFINERQLPGGRATHRQGAAHRHARGRASGKRLLPQRPGGPAGLAGGTARTPQPGTGLYAHHLHDDQRPPGPRTPTPRRRSSQEWVACRHRTSPSQGCGAASQH